MVSENAVSQSFLLSETFKYLYMLFSSEKDTKLQKVYSFSHSLDSERFLLMAFIKEQLLVPGPVRVPQTVLWQMIDNSVFTTEGHILRRFKKTGTQRKTAGKKTKLTVAEKTGTKILTTVETI